MDCFSYWAALGVGRNSLQHRRRPTDATAAAIRELQQQVNELRSAMAEMRAESERYRAENTELRHELQTPRGPSIASTGSPRIGAPPQDSYQMGSPGTMTLRLPNPRKRVGRLL